jgi:ankyrin repeat protein
MKAETVQLLIEHGADVTMQDETYSTPLHLASSKGSAKTVQLLIEHGADVTTKDSSNRTPLHLASSWVSITTVSLLKQQRADRMGRTIATALSPTKQSPM